MRVSKNEDGDSSLCLKASASRMDVGAALAHKNVAGENELTVSALGAKALGVRVAAVLRGAAALLVGEKLKTDVQHGDLPSFL